MATATKDEGLDLLDETALRIFATAPARRPGEADALAAYRQATEFLAVRGKIKAGALTIKPLADEGPQLADCFCPNQPATHVHNLVAKEFIDRKGVRHKGDPAKIKAINDWLVKNPEKDTEPLETLVLLKKAFPELASWDVGQMRTARAIFPAFANVKTNGVHA